MKLEEETAAVPRDVKWNNAVFEGKKSRYYRGDTVRSSLPGVRVWTRSNTILPLIGCRATESAEDANHD